MKQLFSDSEIRQYSEILINWYEQNKRSLPWRIKYSPYEIWISEMMLQQTQMERGVQYFNRWVKRFPDVLSVAEADESEILKYWEGLGYYSRARMLHKTAKKIAFEFNGIIPKEKQTLSSLPGLGEYTVAAIRSIAFNEDTAVCDANVERIFSRLLDIDTPVKQKEAAVTIKKYSLCFLPQGQARLYNQAIMEFGALVCTKNPKCEICPLINICAAFAEHTEKKRPILSEKKTIVPVLSVHGIIRYEDNILLFHRNGVGLWKNMWEFPGTEYLGRGSRTTLQTYLAQFCICSDNIKEFCKIQHGYTNHRLNATFFYITLNEFPILKNSMPEQISEYMFTPLSKLKDFPMPAHHRKAANKFSVLLKTYQNIPANEQLFF